MIPEETAISATGKMSRTWLGFEPEADRAAYSVFMLDHTLRTVFLAARLRSRRLSRPEIGPPDEEVRQPIVWSGGCQAYSSDRPRVLSIVNYST